MGTLFTELAARAGPPTGPRIYADANVPAGIIAFMRETLRWDVLFVVEHDDLRRAPDRRHFVLARQLGRTLVTLDRDYLDDRRFPPAEGSGVVVIQAPNGRELSRLVTRLDRILFKGAPSTPGDATALPAPLPLEGQKLQVNTEWGRDATE